MLNGSPYQEHGVFKGPRGQAFDRAAGYMSTAMGARAQDIEEEAYYKAQKIADKAAARVAEKGQYDFGAPSVSRPSAIDRFASTANAVGGAARAVSGLFGGQGSSPLPSWESSFRMPSVSPGLTAAAAAPSAYTPSGTFNQPWTFPSSLAGGF